MSVELPTPGTLPFQEIASAFAALEEAAAPVPADAFVALADPARRRELEALAAVAGRVVVEVPGGWLTGYDDTIADRLADRGIGVLSPLDRAVLALVVLHTVVVPRARGQLTGGDWCNARGTDLKTLAANRTRELSKEAINRSLRRLDAAGIVKRTPQGGIVPGPQLRRLTPERNQQIWAGVMIAARPHGLLAQVARRQRDQHRERLQAQQITNEPDQHEGA